MITARRMDPSTRKQRQVDLCEIKACLVHKSNAGEPGSVAQRNPVLTNKTNNKKNPRECYVVSLPIPINQIRHQAAKHSQWARG